MREPPCAAHPPVPRAVRAGTGTATPCGPSQPERILKVEVDSKARAEGKSPHMAGRVGRREAGPGQRGVESRRRIGDSEGSSGGEIEKRRRGQGGQEQGGQDQVAAAGTGWQQGVEWSKGRRMRVFEKVLVKRPANVCSKTSPGARCFQPKRRYLGFCGSRSKQDGGDRSSRHALAGVLTTIFPGTRTRDDIDQPPALRLAAFTPLTAALPCASRTLPGGGTDTSGSLRRQRTSRLPAASCSMRSMSCWREWTPSFW